MIEVGYSERRLIVNGKLLRHEGRFSMQEFLSLVDRSLSDKEYTKREKRSEEVVREQGRYFYLELRPYKEVDHYAAVMIKIRCNFSGIKDVVVEHQGHMRQLQEGLVEIYFDAWVFSKKADRWEQKPFVYFLKGWINKYLYAFPNMGREGGIVGGDAAYIYGRLREYFKSFTEAESLAPYPLSDDVAADVAADIARSEEELRKIAGN